MGSLDWWIDLLNSHQADLQILITLQNVNVITPHKIKTSSSDFCLSFVFYRILCSLGQFSPWGRLWPNRMGITSFNSRVLAFLAVTVFWPVRCRVNSLYLSVITETFLCVLPRNRRLSMQCIASPFAFIALETCSNNSPSSNGFKCLNALFRFFPSSPPSIHRSIGCVFLLFQCCYVLLRFPCHAATFPRLCYVSPQSLSGLLGISIVTVNGDGRDLTLLCLRFLLRNDWLRRVSV
jgi:hypothetical protein